MTKSRTQSFKSVKSTKSIKSQTRSMASSFKNAYKDIQTHGLAGFPTRFMVVLVAAIGNTLSYTIRTNMSVTIVAMVNGTRLKIIEQDNLTDSNSFDSCLANNESSSNDDLAGDFTWSETLQGHILGSFYYGYIATNIYGGQLADMFGVRYLCGFVTLSSAMLTLLTPVVAYLSPIALIALRVVTGLAQGLLTPAIYAMLAQWIPRYERGVVLAMIQVGGNLGAVLAMPLSGWLCSTSAGWPSVFYVIGGLGVLCFFLWMYCIYDTPAKHPRILDTELSLIQENVNVSFINYEKERKKIIPWKSILLSLPMWAIAVAKFCGAWGNLMLMSKLPTYLESVLDMSIEMNGIVTAVVYVALSISLTSFGFVSDFVGKKRLIDDTLSRKIFETIALGGPAICLALVPLVRCDILLVIILLVIAMTIFGMNAGGDKPVVVDIAPDHSGTIYGITNAIASLPGILAPLYVGFLLDGKYGSLQQWNIVFYSSSGIYIFGLIFFIIFGTAKPQSWGIIAGRSRGTTLVSNYKGVSAPQTPRCGLKDVRDANGLVFTINLSNEVIQEENEFNENNEEEDYENELFDNLNYFRERRFSIFPIP